MVGRFFPFPIDVIRLLSARIS